MMLLNTSLSDMIMRDAPSSRGFDCYNPEDSWFAKHKYEVANEINESSKLNIHIRDYANGIKVDFPVMLHSIEFVDSDTSDIHSRIFVTFDPNKYDDKLQNHKLCLEFFNDERLNNFIIYKWTYGQTTTLHAMSFSLTNTQSV